MRNLGERRKNNLGVITIVLEGLVYIYTSNMAACVADFSWKFIRAIYLFCNVVGLQRRV